MAEHTSNFGTYADGSPATTSRMEKLPTGGWAERERLLRWVQVVPHPERTSLAGLGVRGNSRSHRAGLLPFEHQGCTEFEPE
jgi:hypothetical protein